jgi:hypothetical protein
MGIKRPTASFGDAYLLKVRCQPHIAMHCGWEEVCLDDFVTLISKF